MPIVTRRMSWLLLTFSFFLVFAPAVFSPVLSAQESLPGEARSVIPMAIQWGIGGVMFVVWLYQFRKSKTSDETIVKLFADHLADSNKIMSTAFEKYDRHIENQVQLLKDAQDKNELLVGTLSRLEVKLSQ